MLDFTSYGGHALLGHEISHVVSQARGEVTGSGFLNDHTLEAKADREGAMAASEQQIAVPTEAMSPVTAAPASGPMQCSGKKDSNKKIDKLYTIGSGVYAQDDVSDEDRQYYDENVKSLSKGERKMIAKRARQSMRDQYDLYQNLTAGPGVNDFSIQKQLAASQSSADWDVYSGMIDNHASANNYNDEQRSKELRSMQGVLSRSDRKKNEELDNYIPDAYSLRGDEEYETLSSMRKGIMKRIYRAGRHS